MRKLAALAALSASALAVSATASFADYTLNILHINDWHSRIESNNKFESTCSAEEETKGECIGGAARLITALAQERKKLEGQNVIFLNAGDNFQGSLFYTTYKGKAEAEFLNEMKPDVMTFGNHEFDDGEDTLAAFMDLIKFPVVSANIKPNDQSKLKGRFAPSIVLEVGGQKIGIVGAVTHDVVDIASPGPNLAIDDPATAIAAEVKKLEAQGVNKIIALTHVGYRPERDVIARIPGVDVVVGGHSHTLLSNTDPNAAGPYPTMVDNPDGYKVPVVQAASYSKYLGEFKVVFDDNGVVKEASGDPIYLDKSITPDPAVLARIKELGAPIEALKAKEVSETTQPIDGSRDNCRARECQMGDLVSDAILDRVKGQGVEIVFQNGGGLRASIDQGTVTMGEVLTVLPFQNTLATFQISGKDVIAALENGASQVEDGAGRFAQVAGLKYAFDTAKPAGSRISDVQVMEGGAWVPIDPAKTYLVATNNYVRQGGDGYKVFADKAQNAYDYGPGLEQVVADYLSAHRPYTPKLDGRIVELNGPRPNEQAADSAAGGSTEAKTAEDQAAARKAEEEAAAKAAADASTKAEQEAAGAGGNSTTATQPATTNPPASNEPPAPAAGTQPAETTPPAAGTQPAETAPASHTIAKGDNYWNLAKTYYNDPTRWRLIADANPGEKPRRLMIGRTLTIPAAK